MELGFVNSIEYGPVSGQSVIYIEFRINPETSQCEARVRYWTTLKLGFRKINISGTSEWTDCDCAFSGAIELMAMYDGAKDLLIVEGYASPSREIVQQMFESSLKDTTST